MHEEKARKGFFVTTSFFADTAYEYAKDKNIELISGTKLVQLMRQAYPEYNDDTVDVMCLQCGDIVTFDLALQDITRKYCKNKHIVENNIYYSDLFKRPSRSNSIRYRKRRI